MKEPEKIKFRIFKNIEIQIFPMEINYHIIIAPFQNKSSIYKNKDVIFKKPIFIKQNVVTFKLNINICIFENKIDRMLSMEYYRGLMDKCTKAHNKIYNIFNDITNNYFIPLYNQPDDPICITDPDRIWDEDTSPLDILESWKKNPFIIQECLNFLERNTKTLNKDLFGVKIVVLLPKISARGNCFQGILKARLSGNLFYSPPKEELIKKIKYINFSI